MRSGVILTAIIGLALATAIAGYVGFDAVFAALSRVGWRGFAVLYGYSALPYAVLGLAWFLLNRGEPLRRLPIFVWARIVRESAGELLPFSHVGGLVIGARAAIERGVSSVAAFSTVVVDVTTELIAQLGFVGLGLGLLALRLGAHSGHENLLSAALGGFAVTGVGAVAFIVAQRRGGNLLRRFIERFLPTAATGAGRVVDAIEDLYRCPLRVLAAVVLHIVSWVVSAIGVWLALRLAGIGVGLTPVLAIESLVSAVRSAAFFAPMGIGVQEATYTLLGPLFGLGPELALAVSLLKRARDLAIGIPALLIWQGLEGTRLVKGNGAAPAVGKSDS
jgi:putative membrane protein